LSVEATLKQFIRYSAVLFLLPLINPLQKYISNMHGSPTDIGNISAKPRYNWQAIPLKAYIKSYVQTTQILIIITLLQVFLIL